MQEFVSFANRLADIAGEIVKKYYRQPFDIERKSDDSPVTIADKAIERAIREVIEAERPEDGILGEEFGTKDSKNGLIWVIDPIDGTKSFMIGRPTFGTLIALCEGDVPKLGIIDQAVLGERWVGCEGQQTTFNERPVHTRKCAALNHAVIGSTSPSMFSETGPVYQAFETSGHKMIWGGDCYMYGLLANGYMDVTIEAALSPYDFAALVPVVEGAGGKTCDYEGQPLTLQSDGRVIAMGDPGLWSEVEPLLRLPR